MGGSPLGNKFFKAWRQLRVARVRIVVGEPGDQRVRRPVLLLLAQHARKQRQHQVGRMLGIEQRILAARQSQFLPQRINRLGPLAARKPRYALDHPPESRHLLVGLRQLGIRRQYRRIECREKRQRRQHVARPGNPRHLRHDRPCIIQLAQQQQIGAHRLRRRVHQVVIRLPQRRKQKITQPVLGAMLDVVHHLHKRVIRRVDVRPDRVKLQTQRLNLRPIDLRHRHHRRVAAPLQLQRQRNQRIGIAKRADVRENNAQKSGPWIGMETQG